MPGIVIQPISDGERCRECEGRDVGRDAGRRPSSSLRAVLGAKCCRSRAARHRARVRACMEPRCSPGTCRSDRGRVLRRPRDRAACGRRSAPCGPRHRRDREIDARHGIPCRAIAARITSVRQRHVSLVRERAGSTTAPLAQDALDRQQRVELAQFAAMADSARSATVYARNAIGIRPTKHRRRSRGAGLRWGRRVSSRAPSPRRRSCGPACRESSRTP